MLLTAVAAVATAVVGALAVRARAALPAVAAASGLVALAWATAADEPGAALVVLAVDAVMAATVVLGRAAWRLLDDAG